MTQLITVVLLSLFFSLQANAADCDVRRGAGGYYDITFTNGDEAERNYLMPQLKQRLKELVGLCDFQVKRSCALFSFGTESGTTTNIGFIEKDGSHTELGGLYPSKRLAKADLAVFEEVGLCQSNTRI